MWPFNRKKKKEEKKAFFIRCPHCGSSQIRIKADSTKIWRGERYLTCRCTDCGKEFYIEEPRGWEPDDMPNDDDLIDNEEELELAERELKRQIEDEDDRLFH